MFGLGYALSLRHVEELMLERGVDVDHGATVKKNADAAHQPNLLSGVTAACDLASKCRPSVNDYRWSNAGALFGEIIDRKLTQTF